MHLERKSIRDTFLKLGEPKRSLNRWLSLLEQNKPLLRKQGSGRPAKIATKATITKIVNNLDHRSGRSQRKLARKLGCHQSYISKMLYRYTSIRCYKKVKKPYMTSAQTKIARPKCVQLLKAYTNFDFILDDESYFTLGQHKSDNVNRMVQLAVVCVHGLGIMGPVISDNNKWLIILYVIQFSGGRCH